MPVSHFNLTMANEIKKRNHLFVFNLQNRRSIFLVCLLLFALTVCVFVPVLRGSFHFFDEQAYILGNTHVNGGLSWVNVLWAFGSFDVANWHPLTWLSHMVDVQVYGLNPWGHHLTNVLLHAINTILVFLVFRRMTGATWRSLIVALLFGLHPLRVEPVAWISERKDVLSTMFWLLAMWTYTRFSEETRIEKGKTKSFYLLTLFFFALGLMSKQMVVTLPFVFLLLDFWPLNRWEQKGKWSLVLEKIPFFVLMVAASIMAYVAKQSAGALQEIHLSLGERVGNAFISYVRYLGKLFWPTNLCLYYPHPGHWPMMLVLPCALFILGVSVMAWVKRKQIPWLFTGWFWYVGTLVPVIGLVQLHSLAMADVWTYVPLMGISLILVWGLCEVTKQWRQQTLILSTLLTVALIPCIIISRHQIAFWQDDITLWTRAINVTKDNYVAHDNLGVVLRPTQADAAFKEFQEAVRINPDFADAQRYLADEFQARGLLDEAIIHDLKSLETDPTSAWAEYALGWAFYKKGQVDEAVAHFQRAVKDEPDYMKARKSLAKIFFDKGKLEESIAEYKTIAELEPKEATAQYDLGVVLLEKGQINEAMSQFQKALKLKPDYVQARNNLDVVLKYKAWAATQTNQPPQ
jgi:Tfp pilus assembly protein PilF